MNKTAARWAEVVDRNINLKSLCRDAIADIQEQAAALAEARRLIRDIVDCIPDYDVRLKTAWAWLAAHPEDAPKGGTG